MENKGYSSSSENTSDNRPGGLRPSFTPFGIWAFSIGTSIGWGSFIVTCNTYLEKSGVLGTVFGLLIGMAVILVITWNLQYMIRNSQDAGGLYSFEKQVAGKDMGFVTFWFILITYLAVLWANITSVPLFARFFLGDTFRFGFKYNIFGYEVWLGEAMLSICAIVLIGLLCVRSSRIPNRIMAIAATTFAIGFTVCAVISMTRHGSTFSYEPMYNEGSTDFAQIIRIAVISPWAFIGFENISHFSEEYRFPVKKIRSILICSVIVTTVLYLFVSLLSVSAYPPEYESWHAYIQDMANLEGIKAVPAFYAANHYLGNAGVFVLMLSLFAVILTSLIGNLMALSRLLYAAGRYGEAPKKLATLNKHAIPGKAIFLIIAVSVFIPFLGRTAIGWIVDITTLGATLMYGLLAYAVYRHAKNAGHTLERNTGIIGLILMLGFLLLLLIPGLLPFHAMETESYVLFIIWSVLGLICFRLLVRRDKSREYGQSVVVWIIFVVLVMFASMMWVSRSTEKAADEAAERIYEYHETHPKDDSDKKVREERIAFLKEQANKVSGTNTLDTLVSLGMFLLLLSIILNNHRHTRKLGKQLTEAEVELADAQKVAELKDTITSLLDNMPGMTFTKDATTGVYLACNQAFAEYSRKNDPDEVVGLTAWEIFDKDTAKKFVDDDKIALSMDEPYIYYEDVYDAAGNQRQLQTTKIKYIDTFNRQCVLGMCQDVTDFVRIQRENVMTKEAYEKARSTGIVYSHIAQSMTRGYMTLYYVNLDTEEFIQYYTQTEGSTLSEAKRGSDFFDACKKDIDRMVYPEDKKIVLEAMDRQTLLDRLDQDRSFRMTYRLSGDQGPSYVSLQITRMEDDDRFIVLGVMDVDEQMKQRRAIELAEEEMLTYNRIYALTRDLICIYVVDPNTNHYFEYRASLEFENLAKEGEDFFATTEKHGTRFVHPDDREHFLSLFKKENILPEIEENGMSSGRYRLIIDGQPIHVQSKAVLLEESDGAKLIIGINNIEDYIRHEEEHAKRLAQVQTRANIDALTGVKNRSAYLDAVKQLDHQIEEHSSPHFAIVMMDVNDLKKVNDSKGHQAGDQYLRDACRVICKTFKHSPVFRIGGDEFAAIVKGDDYDSLDELIGRMNDHNAEALNSGGVVIACGVSKFDEDASVSSVSKRADKNMYENKNQLKDNQRG